MSTRAQLEADRKLRDEARLLVKDELSHVRGELRPEALGERLANRVASKAEDVSDEAITLVSDHRGKLLAGVAAAGTAAALWIARRPLLDRAALFIERYRGNAQGTVDPTHPQED